MSITLILIIVAILASFYVAWNIGANDVANAVGTAVGSKALSIKQAVIIAAVFEFAGAFLLGGYVTKTVESGIINIDIFSNDLTDYVYGMLASLIATGVWLQIASFFGQPVSTTHSIIGSLIGFGLSCGKFNTIYWDKINFIAVGWIISPILGGVVSYFIFSFIRKKILYSHNPVLSTKKYVPYLSAVTFLVSFLIILFGGLINFISINIFALLLILFIISYLGWLFAHFLVRRITTDESDYVVVEQIFVFLQIVIACFTAFAHGSNDVANAIGPISAIFGILTDKSVHGHYFNLFLLLIGGLGIVVGLASWGWRVIATVGNKITELTPSRGFAAGFGTSITIILASKLGLPISTTHVLVGAVLGVGFARGIGAINLRTIRNIILSWLVTMPASAALSGALFWGFKFFLSNPS